MTLFLIVKYYPLSKSKQTLLGLQRGATWRKIIPYKFYELYFGHLSIYRRMIEGEINFTTYYLSFLFVDFLIFFFFFHVLSCLLLENVVAFVSTKKSNVTLMALFVFTLIGALTCIVSIAYFLINKPRTVRILKSLVE